MRTNKNPTEDQAGVAGFSVTALFSAAFVAVALTACSTGYVGDDGARARGNTNPGTAGQVNAQDGAGNPADVGNNGARNELAN